jgi:hypothetical protein
VINPRFAARVACLLLFLYIMGMAEYRPPTSGGRRVQERVMVMLIQTPPEGIYDELFDQNNRVRPSCRMLEPRYLCDELSLPALIFLQQG